MNKKLLFRLAALLAAMMCALGANAAEAYACVSYDTLTFYYDDQRNSHSTATFDVNAGDYFPGWLQMAGVVKYVVFDPSFAVARPTSTRFWFAGMDLESITGLSYLNTSEVINMAYMFSSCFNLTSLDLSSFNTSKVTNMEGMFDNCANLINLDLSSFNTSQVTNMEYMFHDCRALTSVDLSSFNTSQVTNMEYMFADCYVLTSVDLSSFNTSQVTNMRYMFDTCWKLASVDLSSFNTPQVTNMEGMFAGCWALASLDLSSFNTSKVTNMESMFAACTSLTSLDLSSFNTSQVTNMEGMFAGCWALASLDLSSFNTSQVTNMEYIFHDCRALTSVDLSSFSTSQVTNMGHMFAACTSLTSLDLSSFNTSQVTNMESMFEDCTSLHTVCVDSGWTTASVIYSDDMFRHCAILVGGKCTPFDGRYVDKTYAHIDGGPSNPGYLTDVNAPVAYACYTPENTTLTFYYDKQRLRREGMTYSMNTDYTEPRWYTDNTCSSVTRVVFDPSFANARPTATYDWFSRMTNLQTIQGVKYLNTSEVTKMVDMFSLCNKITVLDLSHFNTSQVTNMGAMFYGCTNLRTIYVGSGWTTASVIYSDAMFKHCASLVGGKGTTYDANHVDDEYAHIDGGMSNPGYFTDKNAVLHGDVNGDLEVSVADVNAVIDIILGGNGSTIAADVNGDGEINIADVNALIDIILDGTQN